MVVRHAPVIVQAVDLSAWQCQVLNTLVEVPQADGRVDMSGIVDTAIRPPLTMSETCE